ncbi:hypothetical protein [Maritimibacter sp. UBA3975]|uniref:hypothetical protein n=1 Tax=Maritimibacter sp. UBA3975 TaxID=1946833 RepID=UPI000C09A650|nr:hypothetical protein [Maritimibacter sp. UBA3975]MAM61431.1 hypothetical protein [Maritimibacter sp.]
MHWILFGAGKGNTPFVAYCADYVGARSDLQGLVVAARPNSRALSFFTSVTSRQAQVLPSDMLDTAIETDIIDCVGFGGDPAPGSSSSQAGAALYDLEEIRQVAARLGVPLDDDTFHTRPGVTGWYLYRVVNGDVLQTQQFLRSVRIESQRRNQPAFDHFAGFLAVRAFERVADPTVLAQAGEGRAARGECQEDYMIEFCKGIQMELKRMGVYTGAIDGIIGGGTQAAIRRIADTRPAANPADLISMNDMIGPPGGSPPADAPANAPASPASSGSDGDLLGAGSLDDF